MAAAGFTPISLYYSTTASAQPTALNLALGELAVNITDGKLFYKTVGGVITLLASASTAAGNASNILGGTTGAIVYQSALNTTTFLSIGANTHILTSNGTLPVYTNPASITVGNATTAGSATTAGTATNIAGGTTSALVYQSGAGSTTFLSLGSNNFILTSNGTAPTYTNPASITVGNATLAATATNVANGLANQIVYQTAANTSGFIVAPTTPGFVLGWNGSSFAWVAAPAATIAVNLAGGNAGSVPYQSATSTTAFVTPGTASQVFLSGGTGSPTWVDQSTLSVGNATNAVNATNATNLTSGVAGAVPYQTGVGATGFSAAGTSSQVLLSGGTASPTWVDQSTLSVGTATNATNATNLSSGVAGAVVYQTGVGATGFSAAGTASQVLLSGGTGSPTWVDQSSLSAGSTALATNVVGGAASQILYQSGASTTAFIANGTSGQALVSAGTSAPAWGTLGAAGGGTGLTAPGTVGNVLTSDGTAWTSVSAVSGAQGFVTMFTGSNTMPAQNSDGFGII
jgi:hypothetical protein